MIILQPGKLKVPPKEELEGPDRRTTTELLQFGWFHWLRRRIGLFKLEDPSPSSDPHEQGGLPSNKHVTIALIMDCPTIRAHTGKHYEALIDSGAAISLVRCSMYQTIGNSVKTAIYANSTQLNTADG